MKALVTQPGPTLCDPIYLYICLFSANVKNNIFKVVNKKSAGKKKKKKKFANFKS